MKLQNTEDNFRIQAISGLVLSIESNKNYESQKELQKKISLYSIVLLLHPITNRIAYFLQKKFSKKLQYMYFFAHYIICFWSISCQTCFKNWKNFASDVNLPNKKSSSI